MGIGRAIGAATAAAGLCLAAACAPQPTPLGRADTPVDADTVLAGCCEGLDTRPPEVVRLIEATAPSLVPSARAIRLRESHLADQPEARAYFEAVARPMDILFVAQRAPVASRFVPGYFNHVAIYLGTEAQLRALGAWDDPRFAPARDAIREGRTVIEASGDGVQLVGPERTFDVDSIAILRPTGRSTAERRRAVLEAVSRLGAPFDFLYDLDTPESLYCVEYVQEVLPDQPLPAQDLYGRRISLPDEIVAGALRGQLRLDLVAFIWATPDAWSLGGEGLLARTVAAAWDRPDDTAPEETCS